LSATCFHVELEQFLACFRVARVCQRQLSFLVLIVLIYSLGVRENMKQETQLSLRHRAAALRSTLHWRSMNKLYTAGQRKMHWLNNIRF